MLRLAASAMLVALLGTATPSAAQAARAPAATAAAPKVTGSWVRLPAVGGRPAAGYLQVSGAAGDALVSVRSPRAERVELHSMTHENGVMRMRQEAALEVPAGGTLVLQPGGAHLMLFGLSGETKPGQRLPITLGFRSGSTVTVEAETRAAADPAPGKAPAPAHSH